MPDLTYHFNILRQTRRNFVGLLSPFSVEQLNHIPAGFSNNLFWNAAHVLATQQLVTYGLAGLEFPIPQNFIDDFRKGTHPKRHHGAPALEFLKERLIQSAEQLEADYGHGLFKNFRTYATSYGMELTSIEDAIAFNNVHESMHLGYCMALRKALQ